MRRMICFLKTAFVLIVLCGAAFFVFALYRSPVFEEGNSYTFYFEKNSSALFLNARAQDKILLGGTAGESTMYEGDRKEEIVEKYRARLLFTETAAGVTNYYFYSPLLPSGIVLCGERVNLHIACKEGATKVGTPIIFGGF